MTSESWPLVPLGELAVDGMRNGLSPASGGRVAGRVLTLAAITHGIFDSSVAKDVAFGARPRADQYVRSGLFLICRGNGNLALVGSAELVPASVPDELVFPDTMIGLLPNDRRVDPRYLRCAWASPFVRRQIEAAAKTTNGTFKVNQESVGAIRIPLPPLPEQRRIANLLDRADDLLRKRREAQRLTDALLQSVFHHVFGDPRTNPRGWSVVSLAEVISSSQYGTPAKANTDGVGLPVLRMGNITPAGEWDLRDMKWVALADSDIEKFTVKPGDLLFNRTNSPALVGKTAVWQRGELHAFAGYLIRLRFDPARVLPEYVSAYLNSAFGKRYLLERARPSNNMSNISASLLARMPIPTPPLAHQTAFTAIEAGMRRTRPLMRESHGHLARLRSDIVQRTLGRASGVPCE